MNDSTDISAASTPVDRRSFLQTAGAVAAGAAATGLGFGALGAHPAGASGSKLSKPIDVTLVPVKDEATGLELLKLPKGFRYTSYGWTGDVMDDGRPTPSAHDGMAAFVDRRNTTARLVRNHEQGSLSGAFAEGMTYDPMATGGTTNLEFDLGRQEFVRSYASLSGTIRNCAGGLTPWGSWLTCEETTLVNGAVRHGYVFEVPSTGPSNGQPLKAMGRFSHEAVSVDPRTGIVYLTEDATPSGLYRFVPNVRGELAQGGKLQMAMIGSATVVTYQDTGPRSYGRLSWVDIDNPDPDAATGGSAGSTSTTPIPAPVSPRP